MRKQRDRDISWEREEDERVIRLSETETRDERDPIKGGPPPPRKPLVISLNSVEHRIPYVSFYIGAHIFV